MLCGHYCQTIGHLQNRIEGETVTMYRVVETDNFGGDYPNESFAGPPLSRKDADRVADIFNSATPASHPRVWKVEPETYTLQPGFEP